MATRVFWHIGLPKTGTTYLQDALWLNRDELRARGLLLPGRSRRRHLLASLDLREDPTLVDRPGDIRAPWQELATEVAAWSGDAVISHEFFAAAAPHQIRRALDDLAGAEVHVVLTCRSMVELGISRWQEFVKNGGRADIDRYPRARPYRPADEWGWGSFDLADVLRRWGSVVAPERIHVLPMAPGRSDPQQLWVLFCSVLGVDPQGLDVPAAPVNSTLGVVETELLRRVNPHLSGFRPAVDRGRWIRGHLGTPRVLGDRRERFRPGERKLEELRRRGDEALSMLREGRYHVVGDLDLLQPRDLSGLRHPSEVTDTELLEAATRSIAVLLDDVRRLTREVERTGPNRTRLRVSVKDLLRGMQSRVRGDHPS